jgi:hypothetical protein
MMIRQFNPNNPPDPEVVCGRVPPIPTIAQVDAALKWYGAHPPALREAINKYLNGAAKMTVTRLYLFLKEK